MKATLLLFLIILFSACGSNNDHSSNNLSDFIKANYSHQQSSLNCQLLQDQNLNSVERFIPLFVDSFNKVRNDTDEVSFLFPIQDENISVSEFKILLNYQDKESIDEMSRALEDLSFGDIANCNIENISYGLVNLKLNILEPAATVVEIMECEYIEGYSYATMKLVFEQFIDALTKFDEDISITYSENISDTSNFRWFNIFNSIEDRRIFVAAWQDLTLSREIQSLFLEQSKCEFSNLYRSYKVL